MHIIIELFMKLLSFEFRNANWPKTKTLTINCVKLEGNNQDLKFILLKLR